MFFPVFLAAVCPESARAATDRPRASPQARSGKRLAAIGYTWRQQVSQRRLRPRHTHLPCPAAAPGVTGREPAALRRPACLSSGDSRLPGCGTVARSPRFGVGQTAEEIRATSAPKRPPTSTASTTRRHLRAANSSGYVAWRFRRAASAAALPGARSAPARAVPSRPTGLTKVVSTVAWTRAALRVRRPRLGRISHRGTQGAVRRYGEPFGGMESGGGLAQIGMLAKGEQRRS